jgi:hypothetical protein
VRRKIGISILTIRIMGIQGFKRGLDLKGRVPSRGSNSIHNTTTNKAGVEMIPIYATTQLDTSENGVSHSPGALTKVLDYTLERSRELVSKLEGVTTKDRIQSDLETDKFIMKAS